MKLDDNTRIFAPKSLEKTLNKETGYYNKFLDVALDWTKALIECCSMQNTIFKPFTHNHFVLSQILHVIGQFMTYTSKTHISMNLSKLLIDFIIQNNVIKHIQVFFI